MTTASEWRRGEFLISTDREKLQRDLIHDFLSNRSYWAQQRSPEVVARSLENSLNFGLYKGESQVGLARVVTDYATFAWLADVFIIDEHRGQGLSKWLLEVVVSHPQLQGFRRWVLVTRDAHELYRRFGFKELENPTRWMEKT
ncbi:MAG TPA: GNAT family N-acetyltransferase [Pyrinomonadaceae bacterium]|nr:GNAT family N-acetyltransferase [Pyrinomonadaceae bacterium]